MYSQSFIYDLLPLRSLNTEVGCGEEDGVISVGGSRRIFLNRGL